MAENREYKFSDRQFNQFQSLIMELTSIKMPLEKKELLYGRLTRRLRALQLKGFDDYLKILQSGDEAELESFVNSVTTNLTSFYRERHHFEHLQNVVIPRLRKTNDDTRRIRIWSAGCSTGQEPYSIAMTLMDAMPDIREWDVKILATDIDSQVLETAAKGVYRADRIDGIHKDIAKQWILRGKGNNQGYVRVAPELQELITFKQLNLLTKWPIKGQVDVVFCRNVVIYFDKDTQRVLFEKFSRVLPPQGHMYIGHSETLMKISDDFDLLGKTIYQKAA